MIVDRVQEHLEAIYDVRCAHRASAFVVGDADAKALGGTGRAEEELLLAEDGEELSVALHFSRRLLARLDRFEHAPVARLMGGMLGSYCELAEGVSHFLYVLEAAARARTVSLLELEAQAEVDKFVICVLARWSEREKWARELARRLFDRIALRPGLSGAERWRYTEANRLARSYCLRLMPAIGAGHLDTLLSEVRHSYRMGAEAKLQYFARAA